MNINKVLALSMALSCPCSDLDIHYIWPQTGHELKNRFWLVTRKSYLIGLRTGFFSEYFGNFASRDWTQVRWAATPGQTKTQLRKLENVEQLKIPFQVEGTFGDHHLWSVILLSAILDASHHQNSQKWLSSLTKNKNKMPLSLGQSSTLTCCQASCMAAITRIHKSGCHNWQSEQKDLQ